MNNECHDTPRTSTAAVGIIEWWLDRVIAAIDVEPELPGPMPEMIWELVRDDRTACEEVMRSAVRATKNNIRERVKALESRSNA